MLWFESLLFYGFEEHRTLEKDDGDIGLLPAIVEKVLLSKLSGSESCAAARDTKNDLPRPNDYNMCHVVCGSAGRASVGPAVKQSDNEAGELHSQTR